MNVLSLFDGVSCGMVALERAGIVVKNYYAAEIDKYATKISEANYPNIIRFGDVTNWKDWDIDWSSIDLVLAGFPCQAWSMAGQQQGDKDPRGALFWTTLDIISNVLKNNPSAKFLMENVKMKKEFEDYITHHTEQALGYVEKTLINSALVSAQNRNRFYWTNFKVTQPKDKGILLRDVIEDEFDKCGAIRGRYIVNGKRQDHKMSTAGLTEQRLELRKDDKTNTLTTVQKDNVLVYKPNKLFDVGGGGIGNRVYSVDGKSPALLSQSGGKAGNGSALIYRPCELLEKPTKGGHVANATDIKGNESIKRVYSVDGKSPTLTTMTGGHREPKILIDRKKSYCVDANYAKGGNPDQYFTKKRRQLIFLENNNEILYRKLTPLECERLQTLPDNFTLILDENGKQLVSNTQRYKAIGNGWTVDVIAHIFKSMK